MKKYILIIVAPFLFACTKKEVTEISSESGSLEGGSWVTGCVYSNSLYEIRSVTFSGGQFTQSLTLYSDSNCSVAQTKVDITGTYVLSGKLSDNSDTQKIDETLATSQITPLSSSVASAYNSAALCGDSNWAVGVAKDVAGKTCSSSTMPAVGAVSYDIYYIWPYSMPSMGVQQGMLNFGYDDGSHDGSSPAQRPDSLDGNYNYSR